MARPTPSARVIALAVAGAIGLAVPFEGTRTTGYYDPVGIPTVCTGHTGRDVRVGKLYTSAACTQLLDADVQLAMRAVLNYTTGPINYNELAAYTDFVFNAGAEAFRTSTMLRLFNAGQHTAACNQLPRWVYATDSKTHAKVTLPGLVKRRAAERTVCLTTPKE